MVAGPDWEDMHPSAFPGAGHEPPASMRPGPIKEHVWLGDLSGWSIGLTTDSGCPIILHRCGFAQLFQPHDNFLGNIAEWISQNREGHSCMEVMRAFRHGELVNALGNPATWGHIAYALNEERCEAGAGGPFPCGLQRGHDGSHSSTFKWDSD